MVKIALFMSAIFLVNNPVEAQRQKKGLIIKAKYQEAIPQLPGATLLRGNVRIKDPNNNTIVGCERAIYWPSDNRFKGYRKVKIKKGKDLKIKADSMHYIGNGKEVANIYGNVKMLKGDIILSTSAIKYDFGKNVAHYTTGGTIINRKNDNKLSSKIGYYYGANENMYFRDNVLLTNPDYNIKCDSLQFMSKEEKAVFTGPTWITSKDSSSIYCEAGWYKTEEQIAQFNKNAMIESKDQVMKGDHIYYVEETKFGRIEGNVEVIDTSNKIILNGDFATYNGLSKSYLITGNAVMTQIYETDSLFLHGDTLKSISDTINDTHKLFAYNRVRFYKSDLQGTCDSLLYDETDSLLKLYRSPILWSDENQISGDSISILNYDGKIDRIFINYNAMIISQEDSTEFNQIRGKRMTGFFNENELSKVDVRGSGETVYYATGDDGEKIGLNRTVGSDLVIHIKENKINNISFLSQVTATMYPSDQVNEKDRELKGFHWSIDQRPLNRMDILK